MLFIHIFYGTKSVDFFHTLGPEGRGSKPHGIYFANSQAAHRNSLVGESKAAHARLDAQDVVVHCEHLLDVGQTASLQCHPHLSIVNAGEVAGAGWLVLLWLQGEGVHVDADVWVAGVVVVGLDLVEVLAVLLLEAVLTVQDQLELVQGADLVAASARHLGALLNQTAVDHAVGANAGTSAAAHNQGGLAVQVSQAEGVLGGHHRVRHSHVHVGWIGGEVPQGVQVGGGSGVLVAPHQLLHWVVVRQTDQLGGGLGQGADGVTAGVLHLLDQVLVTLLGEAATLLSVQVHVVGPHLEDGRREVVVEVGRQVEVQAHLVVLQGNQGQVQAWVAVEEEDQGQVHAVSGRAGGGVQGCGGRRHLAVVGLVVSAQEHLGVQTPPGLEVLVDALTTDGQLDGGNGTLSDPAHIQTAVVGGQVSINEGVGCQSHVHVADEVTVASNGHRHAAGRCGGTVHRLLNVLHREVGVTLVHRLEESHLGVTRQVDILSTVSY